MKKYFAFLRGINISGKNHISMNSLKECLSREYANVVTYLNSGNVIFDSDCIDTKIIKTNIEKIIKNNFELDIPICVISKENLENLINNQPEWWGLKNKDIYDNIIFAIEPTTYNEIFEVLGTPNENLEKVQNYGNNIFWSYSLKDYRKTNWWSKTANTAISKKITIRTANTLNKIIELCNN